MCLEFFAHTPDEGGFREGVALFGYAQESPDSALVRFGPTDSCAVSGEPGAPHFALEFTCVLDAPYAILDAITKICFRDQDGGYGRKVDDIEHSLHVQHLPNIHTVRLELRGSVSEYPAITPWLMSRRDRVHHIVFGYQKTTRHIDRLAEELHMQGFFPKISGWTSMEEDRVYWDGPVHSGSGRLGRALANVPVRTPCVRAVLSPFSRAWMDV